MTTTDPIFIVGAPRSGTTLLRAMLNRHPRIGLCDETFYFYYVYARQRTFGDLKEIRNRRLLAEKYIATDRIRRLEMDAGDLTETLVTEGDSYAAFFASLMRHYAGSLGKVRFGEKTPDHAMHAETLCSWYPDCRIIHLLRDPRDVVASLVRMPWGSNSAMANARRWVNCTTGALQCQDRDNYLRLRYEDLVEDPQRELETICRFLGEKYSDAMLVPDEDAKADRWWFERAQGKVTKNRHGKWREELTSAQVAIVEHIAGDHMRRFGYETAEPTPSAWSVLKAQLGETTDSLRRKIVKLPRLWYFWIRRTELAAEEAWNDRKS